MSWLKKFLPERIRFDARQCKKVPDGLWSKCAACEAVLFRAELEKNLFVCPKCDHHQRINARQRLDAVFDAKPAYEEIGASLNPVDWFKFKDSKKYKDRLSAAQKETQEKDALVAAFGYLNKKPLVICAFEFAFIGGSMGAVVGERFCQAVGVALQKKAPLVCFATSGGARMQECLIALMQMAKTAAALNRLRAAGVPYVSVMVDPCTGGVSASLALLGDLNLAEPQALIGFAGPRVIAQTVRETLPAGFQRSEFLLEHGMLDQIVDRRQLRPTLARLLAKLMHWPESASCPP